MRAVAPDEPAAHTADKPFEQESIVLLVDHNSRALVRLNTSMFGAFKTKRQPCLSAATQNKSSALSHNKTSHTLASEYHAITQHQADASNPHSRQCVDTSPAKTARHSPTGAPLCSIRSQISLRCQTLRPRLPRSR